jgi:uncharacterized membrane protein
MKPLIVLISVFFISLLVNKIFSSQYEWAFSGRIAMSAMLLFTAAGHFAFAKGMSSMLPEFIPFKPEIIYFTGFVEIAAAIGLFIPNLRILTAWLLIVFFILILPSNIYASLKQVDFQENDFVGQGKSYLWFRIPLQMLFIVWTYLSSIKG